MGKRFFTFVPYNYKSHSMTQTDATHLFFDAVKSLRTLLAVVRLSSMALALAVACPLSAQRSETMSPRIASLQVVADGDWLSMPVTSLTGGRVDISFDELSHTHRRLIYRVEHCEADWSVSKGLFDSDFVDGFAEGNTIDDCAQSLNTNTIYTHYRLTLPNDRCALKISGNYKVSVFDDDSPDDTLLTACFMVSENLTPTAMEVTTNTDVDVNQSHQQVAMRVDFGSLRVTNVASQVKTVVLQNGRWDNAVSGAKPQYVRPGGAEWSHCRDLIFPAGNEYHKFETLDPTHTTMGLERVGWDGTQYHAWVWTDEPRPNYVYDEDANGAFFIRNSDNIANDTESEYLMTHFRLKSPRLPCDVFVNGFWTHDLLTEQYKMVWNETEGFYEAVIPLKQGYYSYQYIMVDSTGMTRPVPSEGSFYQTENSYQALVYYRGLGERTDRLVGFATVGR